MTVLPSGISGGLSFWYEHGVGVTTGSTFTWADQSGNGRDVSQSTAAKQPTVNASDPLYGSLQTLSFASANVQQLASAGFTFVQPCTIMVIGNTDGSATEQVFISWATANNAIYTTNATQTSYYAGTARSATVASGSAAKPHVYICVFNGASTGFYIDTPTPVDTANPGTTVASGTLQLGCNMTSGTNSLNGKLFEVAGWPKALSATEIAQMLNYGWSLIGFGVSIIGDSFVTDKLSVSRALSDAVAGHASMAENLSVSRSMNGSIVAQATMADTLAVNRVMSAPILGQSASAKLLALKRPFASSVSGHGVLSNITSVSRALSDVILGQCTLSDTLAVKRTMSDAVAGRAAIVGATTVRRSLASSVLAHGALAAALPGPPVSTASVTVKTTTRWRISGDRCVNSYSDGTTNATGCVPGTFALAAGYNAIPVPSGAVGVVVVPPYGSSVGKTLVGAPSDIGTPIDPANSTRLNFVAGQNTTFGIVATGPETLALLWL